MPTLVDQVRQLKAELRTCEQRAAEIRRLLTEVSEEAALEAPAPSASAEIELRFLRLLALGPRAMSEFIVTTERSRGTCLRTLDALVAAELVVGTGKGPGRRWHLTDLGARRIATDAPSTDETSGRLAEGLRQIPM